MYQEAEQGIWKSVLGALGAASVILTIVGNLVFTSGPSTIPTSNTAGTGIDRPARLDLDSPPPAQVRRIEAVRAVGKPSKPHETIVTIPRAIRTVDSPNTPCDTATDVQLADQSPPVAPTLERFEQSTVRTVEPAPMADEAANSVIVAERAPVVEPVPSAEQVLPVGDAVAAAPAATVPVEVPELIAQVAEPPATIPAVDADQPDRPAIASTEFCGPRVDTTDIAGAIQCSPVQCNPIEYNTVQCITVQKLSHYERKMLRKIAHLERKKSRLFRGDCELVCR